MSSLQLPGCRARPGEESGRSARTGFTILELLVSMTVLAMLLGVLLSITSQTQKTYSRTQGAVEQFREARAAFEAISRNIRQATLNTYWDYDFASAADKTPQGYARKSELRFLSGPTTSLGLDSVPGMSGPSGHATFFQAPLGYSTTAANRPLNKLLNTMGYYVDLRDGQDDLPQFFQSFAQPRWRMRLYEFREPSETLSIYQNTSGNPSYTGRNWFSTALGTAANSRPIASNIIALIVRPKYPLETGNWGDEAALAPNYTYDSSGGLSAGAVDLQKHKLPPTIQLTVVAIDELSAARLSKSDLVAIGTKVDALFGSNSGAYTTRLAKTSWSGSNNSLEDYLIELGVNYRIYSSVINLSGSEWSK